jgi:hypothetical protein
MRNVTRLEFLDRQLSSRPDRYLTLETLRVRNHYDDGATSREYDCDFVKAPGLDAVAVILFCREGERVMVGLIECVRPPVTVRRELELMGPDEREYVTVTETVAGRLEPEDVGEEGIDRRAAIEAREEGGFEVRVEDAVRLGKALFTSPGMTPEKVFFRAFEVDPGRQQLAHGDGSPMEDCYELRFIELSEGIRQCWDGVIEDPKAEIGFRRLAEWLGARSLSENPASRVPRD